MTGEALTRIAESLRAVADALAALAMQEPAPAPAVPEVLTPAEIAAAEKVSSSYVLAEIRRGSLRAAQLGPRTWRIDRADYLEWKRARRPRRRVA